MTDVLIEPHDHEAIAVVDRIEMHCGVLPEMTRVLESHTLLAPRDSFRPKLPINANCIRTERAIHHSGLRPLTVIDLQVIHDEESMSALAAASWFHNPESAGSAQLCIDEYTCYRTLPDNYIPWAAPGANYHGLHYEQAGYARWTNSTWRSAHLGTIKRTAYKMANDSRKYGIAIRWLDASALRRGIRNGQTSHAECTKAFGGTHTDPGKGYPRQLLMSWLVYYRQQLRHVQRIA